MSLLSRLVRAVFGEPRLKKPVQVGGTLFGIGVPERMVIERAEREHEYRQTPEREARRIAQSKVFFRNLDCDVALQELVALKDMKDHNEPDGMGMWKNEAEHADYKVRQPLAWEAARRALKGRP